MHKDFHNFFTVRTRNVCRITIRLRWPSHLYFATAVPSKTHATADNGAASIIQSCSVVIKVACVLLGCAVTELCEVAGVILFLCVINLLFQQWKTIGQNRCRPTFTEVIAKSIQGYHFFGTLRISCSCYFTVYKRQKLHQLVDKECRV